MSYVGKILVIVQVVMSIMFMAFAGAVYTMHANWKNKFEGSQLQVTKLTGEVRDAQTELSNARDKFKEDLDDATGKKLQADALNKTLTDNLASMELKNADLERQREAAVGLGQTKANEAAFRQVEAERLRIANDQLQETVNQLTAESRKQTDQIFLQQDQLAAAGRRNQALLEQMAFLKETVVKHNLPTDPEVVTSLNVPAPPVDGIVQDVQRNRSNRVSLLSITIGSDDGLKMGDILSVYRAKSPNPVEFLGTVQVKSLSPDSAVCEMVMAAKNGIIEEGDNVTTRF